MSKKLTAFFGSFTVFKGAAPELWLTFLIKFLIVAAFQISVVTLVRWLSSDLGMSDREAQGTVMAWAITMIVVTLLVGSLTDALGLRRTFFLGVWICLIARAVMALSPVKWVSVSVGLFLLAIGEALGTPVLVAATRKYSNTQQRSMAFSLIYVVMNLGFLAANYVYDWVRQGLGEYGYWTVPFFGWHITTYRTLFLVSWVIELLILPAIWFLRDGVNVTDEGVTITPREKYSTNSQPILIAGWEMIRQSASETAGFFVRLVKQAGFYQLLSFLLLIALIKIVFTQLYYVFPTWGVRELGPGAPVGRLLAINNWFIIFLVPIIGALTRRSPAYWMVVVGGCITAASVFFMALPPAWFAPIAHGWVGDWIGHFYLSLTGAVHPYYVMIAFFIIILSFGEALYSPRVYEYAAAIAPKGQEASYGALSYIPSLGSKIFATMIAGNLLAKYCPEHGPRNSAMLWLMIALTATVAPVGLVAFQRFIRVQEAGRPDSDTKE
ncbi:major facilitator superfamily MFS_1 [Chthoniobacter flavus Ellin428]|uniref:Major facilitator superfamily MFS_1 n=1 Tax=Chthoniobacter flavus Ellin428 TaxID=497964 RepID=B4D3G4_9BACT|nr:MFS transporter [Chthoniobacter flavus]EDY18794.1 major facilitator superfamily MFS_1 [Chthoniobacter flavus Ellin428]